MRTKFRNQTDTYKKNAFARAKEIREYQVDGISHAQYAKTEQFVEACGKAGVKPTKRQASKYRKGEGLAFAAK